MGAYCSVLYGKPWTTLWYHENRSIPGAFTPWDIIVGALQGN